MDRNQDSLQDWCKATAASATTLGFVAVCLRLLARYEKKQKLWWDDWMIIWSLVWNLVIVIILLPMMIHYGLGLHADTLPVTNLVMIAKLLIAAEVLYVYNLAWTKIALLMMYYRIFHFAFFKRWAYVIGAVVVAWVICVTFLFIFTCVPVQKIWYQDLEGHCISQIGVWVSNAVSTIVTDVAILILPIPQVWKLQLRSIEKVAITLIFLLGSFVICASAYRFTVLFTYTSTDPSYTLTPTVGWSTVEMSVGIISACLPTLRPAILCMTRKLGLRVPSVLRGSQALDSTKSSITSPNTLGATDARRGGRGPDLGYENLVTGKPGVKEGCENLSQDEIPLHSIRVQTEIWRRES